MYEADVEAAYWTRQEQLDAIARLRAEANRNRLNIRQWPFPEYGLIAWEQYRCAVRLIVKARRLRREVSQDGR